MDIDGKECPNVSFHLSLLLVLISLHVVKEKKVLELSQRRLELISKASRRLAEAWGGDVCP